MPNKQRLDRELRKELRDEGQLHESEKDDSYSDDDSDERAGKRGRKFIPFAWSRVILVDKRNSSQVTEHWIKRDQIIQGRQREDKKRLTLVDWKPLFLPNAFAKQTDLSDLEKFRLNESQLKRHALSVCKLRKDLRQRALKVLSETRAEGDIDSVEIPKL